MGVLVNSCTNPPASTADTNNELPQHAKYLSKLTAEIQGAATNDFTEAPWKHLTVLQVCNSFGFVSKSDVRLNQRFSNCAPRGGRSWFTREARVDCVRDICILNETMGAR
jgi:hypothetical protein